MMALNGHHVWVYVMRQLLSKRHSTVVLQFLAGQVAWDLLPAFFASLNEWLHQNWNASPILSWESKEEAESRHRLFTCLKCVKEAFREEDYDFPDTLKLPQRITLRHSRASDLLLLAKAMKNRKDVRR